MCLIGVGSSRNVLRATTNVSCANSRGSSSGLSVKKQPALAALGDVLAQFGVLVRLLAQADHAHRDARLLALRQQVLVASPGSSASVASANRMMCFVPAFAFMIISAAFASAS